MMMLIMMTTQMETFCNHHHHHPVLHLTDVRGLLDEKPAVGIGVVRVVHMLGMFRRAPIARRAPLVRPLGRDGLVECGSIEENATRGKRKGEPVLGETRRPERRADTLEIQLGGCGGV